MFEELGNHLKAPGQGRPPKATFSADQIPDFTGLVMIVTGEFTGQCSLDDSG